MRRFAFPLVVVVCLAGCGAGSRLDALVGDLHERGLFDGAVVIGHGERVVWAKGFGYAVAEAKAPFTPDTPADGGSLAKTMTAALVLELAQEGRLRLDESAQRLVPELPYPAITLRHLLSHSNGLPDYGFFDRFLAKEAVRTTEGFLAILSREKPPLAFEPGTAFEYSSLGFDIAALAAARAAGSPYGELLEQRFFEPLGITSAFLRPARFADFPGVRTRGYKRAGGRLEPNEVFDYEAFHGGSNVYLSARDLYRWSMRVPSLGALQRARIGTGISGLTLGSWYTFGSAWWYSGHLQGFHSEVFRNGNTSIVYVSNHTIAPWLQKGLVRAIGAVLAGGSPAPLQPPAVRRIEKSGYDALTGRWNDLSIERAGDHLTMTSEGVAYRMVQIDPSFFYVPGLDYIVGFDGARLYLSSNVAERYVARG